MMCEDTCECVFHSYYGNYVTIVLEQKLYLWGVSTHGAQLPGLGCQSETSSGERQERSQKEQIQRLKICLQRADGPLSFTEKGNKDKG